MAERNHLMRAFRRHDSRDARRGERLAFLEFPADYRLQRRRRHPDLSARNCHAPRDRLFADIDHPDLSAGIKMRQARGNCAPLWGLFLARHLRKWLELMLTARAYTIKLHNEIRRSVTPKHDQRITGCRAGPANQQGRNSRLRSRRTDRRALYSARQSE